MISKIRYVKTHKGKNNANICTIYVTKGEKDDTTTCLHMHKIPLEEYKTTVTLFASGEGDF